MTGSRQGIQYPETFVLATDAGVYWIIRFRG